MRLLCHEMRRRSSLQRACLVVSMAVLCLVPGCGGTRAPPASRDPGTIALDAAQQASAERWNAVFGMKPRAAYGWSGGDAAVSLALPFCPACPVGSQYRFLWLFGDSAFSTVDEAGFRVRADGRRGADYAFGNVAALSSHGASSGRAPRTTRRAVGKILAARLHHAAERRGQGRADVAQARTGDRQGSGAGVRARHTARSPGHGAVGLDRQARRQRRAWRGSTVCAVG